MITSKYMISRIDESMKITEDDGYYHYTSGSNKGFISFNSDDDAKKSFGIINKFISNNHQTELKDLIRKGSIVAMRFISSSPKLSQVVSGIISTLKSKGISVRAEGF